MSVHKGDWDGPIVPIAKRRARSLLAVLAAHQGAGLTREMTLEILWPDSDPESAINSLNQTVFQLRRYIDPGYRGGESPEYITSTTEHVGLNADLILTDVSEVGRLTGRLSTLDWHQRQAIAARTIQLVRGEFLADLRYEHWASRQQMIIHARIRKSLLPIAQGSATSYTHDVAAQAANALLLIDPFDEPALISLAESMHKSGRRAAAHQVIADFARRMASDLDIEPSPELLQTAANLGLVKRVLTD
jgi:DNA-binding SARP family transcriptional activator